MLTVRGPHHGLRAPLHQGAVRLVPEEVGHQADLARDVRSVEFINSDISNILMNTQYLERKSLLIVVNNEYCFHT